MQPTRLPLQPLCELNPGSDLTGSASVEFIEGLQHLFGAGSNSNVLGQIHPPNRTRGINEKFGRPSDVDASGSCSSVQQIVAANHLRLNIGKQRIGKAELVGVTLINLRRVDTDAGYSDASRLEIGKPLLKTPQLGAMQDCLVRPGFPS
jgi:hypothetical protein